jgi:hypothetical protein
VTLAGRASIFQVVIRQVRSILVWVVVFRGGRENWNAVIAAIAEVFEALDACHTCTHSKTGAAGRVHGKHELAQAWSSGA